MKLFNFEHGLSNREQSNVSCFNGKPRPEMDIFAKSAAFAKEPG
jgi:hypothetical protein